MKKTIAILPAYCPGRELITLAEQLGESSVETIVVNDGSPEEYQSVFDSLPKTAAVLCHEQNMGKGEALKTAMKYIRRRNRDCIVVTADADGQHLVNDILNCAKEAENHTDHLVLGVRDFSEQDVPFRSALGNRITSILFLLFTGRWLADTQTGLRAFHSSMIPLFLETEGSRYEYEMNQLLRAVSDNIPFSEVKIKTVYLDGNKASHYRPLRDSLRILRQFLLFSVSSLAGFLIDYSAFAMLNACFSGPSGILVSNVIARIFSALCNFELNRRVVFRQDDRRMSAFIRYALLATGILILNTGVLSVLTFRFHIHAWIAKLMTELLLFLFSWFMQKKVVFADRTKGVPVL